MREIKQIQHEQAGRGDPVRPVPPGSAAASEVLSHPLTAHIPVSVFVTDAAGQWVYANERNRELTGLAFEASLGSGWRAAVHPADAERVGREWSAAAGSGDDFTLEYRLLRPAGDVAWIEARAAAFRDPAGELLGWVGASIDITARRRGEESLRKAQEERTLMLGRTLHAAENERLMMATALHDGPIQYLSSFGYTLDRLDGRLANGDLADGIALLRSVRDDLTREVETLRRMMDELRPPVLDDRGVETALREYTEAFEHRTGLSCTFVGGLGDVRVDPHIETILYRATQEALGNIEKHARAKQARVELREAEDGVSLLIADDGDGFEPDHFDEVFGVGRFGLLGLRDRVEGAGGGCRIETEPGQGTRIELSLPCHVVRAPGDRMALSGPSSPAPGTLSQQEAEAPRVLVVDDEPRLRSVLAALLVDGGFDVVAQATTGAEAVQLALELRPEVVLMDIRMPVMDGLEAARRIRAGDPGIKIVLLSGSHDRITAADCLAANVFDLVPKGGAASVIYATLRSAWRLARDERGASHELA